MTVEVVDDQQVPVDRVFLESLAGLVLASEGFPAGSEVAITLVDDDAIAELNERHMARPGPTDVLAFPLLDLVPGVVPAAPGTGPPLLLGDVVIAPAYVARQAAALGVPVEAELALMVVHGILHLLGYDHVNDADAELMEARERSLLAAVGWERR